MKTKRAHHLGSLLSCTALAACTASTSSGTSDGGAGGSSSGGGSPMTCAQIEAAVTGSFGTFVSGSWGLIPPALQALPAGAELCGTTFLADGGQSTDAQTIVTMPLTSSALSAYYTPIFLGLGCHSMATSSAEPAGSLAFAGCNANSLGGVYTNALGQDWVFLSYGTL
jgi:hypothetical protein